MLDVALGSLRAAVAFILAAHSLHTHTHTYREMKSVKTHLPAHNAIR